MKKFEAVWNLLIKTRHLNDMLPVLEAILSKVDPRQTDLRDDSVGADLVSARRGRAPRGWSPTFIKRVVQPQLAGRSASSRSMSARVVR